MLDFVPLVALAALVFALVNFLKALKAGDTNAWLTQLIVWIAGVVVLLLVAETDFASGIVIGDLLLVDLNFASLIFVGLTLGSTATFLNEAKKAVDNNDSAQTPSLFK